MKRSTQSGWRTDEKVGRTEGAAVSAVLCAALPERDAERRTHSVAILDRTKEAGAIGEPLYLDVVAAYHETNGAACPPRIVGGRYGFSSKEFTPAMVKAVFDELKAQCPKNHFTVGIRDDVTHTSLDFDPAFSTEDPQTVRAVFYGLGSDGTVGANKNSIKIIGEETDNYAQGYFVYDSKKAGVITMSHLRLGPQPIRSTYLISRGHLRSLSPVPFLERNDVLAPLAQPGATFLFNCPYGRASVGPLPREVQ